MPELSRFFGIVIRMYVEPSPHHAPHFHAYYAGMVVVFGIDPIEAIAGSCPFASDGWLRHGQRFMRMSCGKTGNDCSPAMPGVPSIR